MRLMTMRALVATLIALAPSAHAKEPRFLGLYVAAVQVEDGVPGKRQIYVQVKCFEFKGRFDCELTTVIVNNCDFMGGDRFGELGKAVQWPIVETASTADGSLVIVSDQPRQFVIKHREGTPTGDAETTFRFDLNNDGGVAGFSGTTTKNSDVLKKMIAFSWEPYSLVGDTSIPSACEFYAPAVIPTMPVKKP